MSNRNNLVKEAEAEAKNTEADEWMYQKKYANALYLYCGAIQLCPNKEKYYVNRARCHLLMNELQKAQNDAKKAIELNTMFLKGYITLIKCYLATGDLAYAETTVQTAQKIYPTDREIKMVLTNINYLKDNYQKYKTKYDVKKYEEALQHAENCMAITPQCVTYKYAKIQCLNALQRFPEIEFIADEILKMKPTDENAKYFKTAAQCYHRHVEQALPLIKKLRIELPDHEKTKQLYKNTIAMSNNISTIKMELEKKNYKQVHETIKKTIKIDENFLKTNKKLRLININDVVGQEKNDDELLWNGVLDCIEYIRLYGFDLNIFKTKIQFLMLSAEYEDAIEDLNELCRREKSEQNSKELQNAKKLFEDQLTTEYKILRIPPRSPPDDIKKAVMKLKKRYHPDKNVNVSKERKKQLEDRLIRVQRAEERLLRK